MQAQMRHWPWALMAFILAAALLFGGRTVYVKSAEQSPFLQAARSVPGVARVRLVDSLHVDLWLTDGARPDAVYAAVSTLTAADLGSAAQIQLMDNPSPAETRVGNQVGLMVAEAESQGNYVAMAQSAQTLAAQHGQQLQWTLGAHDIFITLTAGSHRLIHVYPLNWVPSSS
jgi:hypothetical protein